MTGAILLSFSHDVSLTSLRKHLQVMYHSLFYSLASSVVFSALMQLGICLPKVFDWYKQVLDADSKPVQELAVAADPCTVTTASNKPCPMVSLQQYIHYSGFKPISWTLYHKLLLPHVVDVSFGQFAVYQEKQKQRGPRREQLCQYYNSRWFGSWKQVRMRSKSKLMKMWSHIKSAAQYARTGLSCM